MSITRVNGYEIKNLEYAIAENVIEIIKLSDNYDLDIENNQAVIALAKEFEEDIWSTSEGFYPEMIEAFVKLKFDTNMDFETKIINLIESYSHILQSDMADQLNNINILVKVYHLYKMEQEFDLNFMECNRSAVTKGLLDISVYKNPLDYEQFRKYVLDSIKAINEKTAKYLFDYQVFDVKDANKNWYHYYSYHMLEFFRDADEGDYYLYFAKELIDYYDFPSGSWDLNDLKNKSDAICMQFNNGVLFVLDKKINENYKAHIRI